MTDREMSPLEAREHVSQEKERTRSVLWKLDVHILPALALLWLANFLDR